MFKFLRGISKSKVLKIGLAVLLTAVIAVSGVTVSDKLSPQSDGSFQVGVGQKVLTIGAAVYAAGTVDYTTDGVADDVQFQAAVDALPAAGGKISVLTGNYVFSATVTRAIANVTIEGNGLSTNFTYDGVNPIFTAGGNRWVFANFVTDAGGINLGATTGWEVRNLLLGATYYAYRNPAGLSVFNDTTVASLTDSGLTNGRVPIAGIGGLLGDSSNLTWANPSLFVGGANVTRGYTRVVASVNASSFVRSQADYVADGTADEVEIQAAIDDSTNGTVKLIGSFTLANGIVIGASNFSLDMRGAKLTAVGGFAADPIIEVSGASDVEVVGGEIDGNKAGQAIDIYGILIGSSARVRIHDIYVHDTSAVGIYVGTASDFVWVYNNYIEDIGTAGTNTSDGIDVISASAAIDLANVFIVNNVVYNAGDEGIGVGEGTADITILGNQILGGTDQGITINTHPGVPGVARVRIEGNIIVSATYVGIGVGGVTTATAGIDEVEIVNNTIYSNGTATAAIYITGWVTDTRVNGNRVIEATTWGIRVQGSGAVYPVVTQMNFNDINRTGSPSGRAVSANDSYVGNFIGNRISWIDNDVAVFYAPVGTPATYMTIALNVLTHTSGNGKGIWLREVERSIIKDNIIRGTFGGGNEVPILEEASCDLNWFEGNDMRQATQVANIILSGTNRIFVRNLGYLTENSGSAIILNGNQAVVVAHGLSTTPTGFSIVSTVNETGLLYVTSANATSFTINSANNVTGNRTVYWRGIAGAGN